MDTKVMVSKINKDNIHSNQKRGNLKITDPDLENAATLSGVEFTIPMECIFLGASEVMIKEFTLHKF